jgi:hypothetical protein
MKTRTNRRAGGRAFSLMEVMIAIGIFFSCIFVILSLVSSSLRNARRLERPMVDAHPVLARYAATNSFVEGHFHGNLGEPDLLGKGYENYIYDGDIVEVLTNRYYIVECKILEPGGNETLSDLSSEFYRPQSPAGSLDGATVAR